MQGLYRRDCAKTLGHNNGFCTLCPDTRETLEHIFFTSSKAQRGWAGDALYFELNPCNSYMVRTHLFIDILDSRLEKLPKSNAQLYVIYQTDWMLWLHTNIRVY